MGTEERRRMIEPAHPKLPVSEQCELLGLPRSSYYHRPLPESEENQRLMRMIDEMYLAQPFYGSRQMTRDLRRQGYPVNGKPEIVNTEQGCQFTSAEFTRPLLEAGIKLSMDGKGRCLDNVFVERLWRTVKYEEVYLKSYHSLVDAHAQLET
jgi:hypothetical protein